MSPSLQRITGRALRALPLLALAAMVAGAQGSPEAILQRYAKAVDPDNKLASIEGFRTVATMEMPAQGMTMTMTSMQRRPDHIAVTMEMAGLGSMRSGFDGTTAWSIDPMGGPRILGAEETKQLKDNADFKMMARDPSTYVKAEAAGEAQVDGEATDCVKVTWKSDRVTTECFSRASGLLLEARTKTATPQGEVETVTRMYDYKSVGGIMMPHRMVNNIMGMTQNITLTETAAGPLPDSAFALPPEIQALKKP
jgi:hypothetical protein